MFDGLKNMAGMASIMRDLPKLQARMEEVKASLSGVRVQAVSEGGRVTVTADAAGNLVDLTVSGGSDEEILETANRALVMGRQEAQRRLSDVAREMGLPSEGLGLPGAM
ncbi:MAG: YbaB/EbfC family nucleoid-associated protein [Phycisphaerales bacterium]|jgi:DNA-binding protein YbaB|nr:YbaB/EbfC family nucleoid-associated protein [Phycisphaerales bacterium]